MGIEITDTQKSELLTILKHCYGYDFCNYSDASIKRRINRFSALHNFPDYFEMKHHLLNNNNLFKNFVLEVTVNVTEMFREPEFFVSLQKKVYPYLDTYPFFKIWHAGCSTGEEVYSNTILLEENNLYKRSKIYATDINSTVLKTAREGIYPNNEFRNYNRNYIEAGGKFSLSDYYTSNYNMTILLRDLKKNLVFSSHNLVTDKSFNEFQLIVCRNVLIYFNRKLQEKVIKLFYDSLVMFGYLTLGSKESLALSSHKDKFEVVDKKEKIYRKIK